MTKITDSIQRIKDNDKKLFSLEFYVNDKLRITTVNMTLKEAVARAKKHIKLPGEITNQGKKLPYSGIDVIFEPTSVVYFRIDNDRHKRGTFYHTVYNTPDLNKSENLFS